MRYSVYVFCVAVLTACPNLVSSNTPVSNSGVSQAQVDIKPGSDGLTTEQRNIKRRYQMDNQPGSIKHLYVVSSFSGDVIIYSTVDGKVTSSGKRLSPTSVAAADGQYVDQSLRGMSVQIAGELHHTSEVIQDDGTYGNSDSYLYWFDSRGIYHQHYLSGGQILHISDQPLRVGRVIINMEQTGSE